MARPTSDDSEYMVPRNEFETVDGMPVYYGGDLNDSDCEDPRNLAYEDWVEWCDFNAPDGYCGFFRMTGRPSCLLRIVPL